MNGLYLKNITEKWQFRFTNPEAYRKCRIEMTVAMMNFGVERSEIPGIVDKCLLGELAPEVKRLVLNMHLVERK